MAKLGCEDVNPKETNFKQPKSILSALLALFRVPTSIQASTPKALILASKGRSGLSPKMMASRVIQRQSEAGLHVGPLGTGEVNPAEIMERIRMEEIVNSIATEMKIELAITPGGKSTVTGTAGPIPVVGTAILSEILGGSGLAS